MSDLIVICEGQTEESFCNDILKPYFAAQGKSIEFPLILHSGGGIVPWRFLRAQIETHHLTSPNASITTFIDYYGMLTKHQFPNWAPSLLEGNKNNRMAILEQGMRDDLSAPVQAKFVPYIQLHEYEALVLSDYTVFGQYYSAKKLNAAGLAAICALPPETVNDGVTSAPSKRLESNIRGYDKVTDGVELAKMIGLPTIRGRCPRFDGWLQAVEAML
jgi:Domain of unknown function (DUF4276)